MKKIIMAMGSVLILGLSFFLFKNNYDMSGTHEQPHVHREAAEHQHQEGHRDHEENKEIRLTEEQIKRFEIQTLILTQGHFQHHITVPGEITLNENTITHVVASVSGIAKEIFKGLGESVKTGELLATLQSQDMAEAKSSYISAYKNLELKKDLFERDQKLWKLKVKPEVEFIQTRYIYESAKIDLEQKKQKLLALNLSEDKIQQLLEHKTALNIYLIDSPINGQVIERHITSGEVISSDKQVFVIANLDTVWANLAVPMEDLPKIKGAQQAYIFSHQGNMTQEGTITYVSPVINDESRTGRAIVHLNNSHSLYHPGDFITARVIIGEQLNSVSLPRSAMQIIDGNLFVFVKTENNLFEARPIQIKGSDKGESIEVLNGVKAGDEIVIKNTFLLKAELGKSKAEHSH